MSLDVDVLTRWADAYGMGQAEMHAGCSRRLQQLRPAWFNAQLRPGWVKHETVDACIARTYVRSGGRALCPPVG